MSDQSEEVILTLVDEFEVAVLNSPTRPSQPSICLILRGQTRTIQSEKLAQVDGQKLVFSPSEAVRVSRALRTLAEELRRRHQH